LRHRIVISSGAGIRANEDRLTALPLDFLRRALASLAVDIRDYDLCVLLRKAQTSSVTDPAGTSSDDSNPSF
jgi:hypothetical protein